VPVGLNSGGRAPNLSNSQELSSHPVQGVAFTSEPLPDFPWDRFEVVYQPVVDLHDGETIGYEALTRGPAGTAFETPDAFFALAASLGRVTELDWACIRAAVKGYAAPEEPLFVNVRPETLMGQDPMSLRMYGKLVTFRPKFPIVAEVSERGFVAGSRLAVERLRVIQEKKVALAVDDFGTGYSGLLAFASVKPDYIKVDRSFVAQVSGNANVRAIIRALVQMADDVGARLVAEGVETEEERENLTSLGVRLAQGFFFGRPGGVAKAPR